MHVRTPEVDAVSVMRATLKQMTPEQLKQVAQLVAERYPAPNLNPVIKSATTERLKSKIASLETRMALLERSMKVLLEDALRGAKVGPHNIRVKEVPHGSQTS